jgi:predicted esterase
MSTLVRFLQRGLPTAMMLILSLLLQPSAYAQDPDALAAVRADWHLCGIAESRSEWQLASDTYQKVIEESSVLPLNMREWFRGTAAYGIARCQSRLQNADLARVALGYAAEHHFWNFALIRTDSVMVRMVGSTVVDSLDRVWSHIAASERTQWLPQAPISYTPRAYDRSPRWPLIIAMHGGNGNYESFASRCRAMADTLGAVIIVPAGVLRESQITNSWGANFDQIAGYIIPLVRDLVQQGLVDSQQVYLTGFSQGAQATIELCLRYPHIFRGGIPMSGFSSTDFSDSLLIAAHNAGTRLYAISGEYEDANFRSQLGVVQARCHETGVPFILNVEPQMIHEVPLDLERRFVVAWNWVRTGAMQ